MTRAGGARTRASRSPRLDALARLSTVAEVMPQQGWNVQCRYRDQLALERAAPRRDGANWPSINPPDMQDGRVFTEQESRSAAPVVIINTNAKQQLFGDEDALGKEINLTALSGNNVGEHLHGDRRLEGQRQLPLRRRPPEDRHEHLRARAQAGRADAVHVARRQAERDRDAGRDDRRRDGEPARDSAACGPSRESNFAVITQDKLFDVYNKVFGMFFLVMIALSSVGLLVGGVGVVAIMMISVTERTREIGVRKALGATRGVILWQFLVEAVTLTATGAAIGLVLGWIVALIVNKATPVQASVPPLAVVAALGIERGHRDRVRHAARAQGVSTRSGGRTTLRMTACWTSRWPGRVSRP